MTSLDLFQEENFVLTLETMTITCYINKEEKSSNHHNGCQPSVCQDSTLMYYKIPFSKLRTEENCFKPIVLVRTGHASETNQNFSSIIHESTFLPHTKPAYSLQAFQGSSLFQEVTQIQGGVCLWLLSQRLCSIFLKVLVTKLGKKKK